MRTIKVTGSSTLKLKPNLIKVSIEIKGTEETFDEVVIKSSEDTEKLKQIVENLHFNRKDLKTINFDINAAYENYYDENNHYKNELIGYKYNHSMYLQFPMDHKLLGDLLYALAKSNIHPKFIISYSILDKEKEEYKNRLIKESVKNARARADILAASAGVVLGEILTIDYSDKTLDFTKEILEYQEDRIMLSKSDASYQLDIKADDITVSDSVNIVWRMI